MYPSGPQDIFAGQDLVLLARYDGSGPANVVVTGRSGGREIRWTSERNFAREERENAFVPRLWATQRIGWLAAEKRRNGGNSEIDDEIRRLGERFGIPTEFTSYLVLEPGMVAGNPRPDVLRRSRGDLGAVSSTGSGSAAPAAAAPQQAFEQARAASEQRQAKSVAASDALMHNEAAVAGSALRRAGAKVFQQDGETWTDLAVKPNVKVYKVAAYAQSYFALLDKLPQLKEWFAVAERVKVAGKSVAIEIVDSAEELSEAEIRMIIAGF
jgi:Ca-activated chloride channel family protein